MTFRPSLSVLMPLLASFSAAAFEPLTGAFLAQQACPAGVSLSGAPDGQRLRAGERYPALGLNRRDGEFIQLRVPGAKPEARWVQRHCGVWEGATAASAAPAAPPQQLLLSLSWQPAFCESQPGQRECQTQTATRFDADHFSLHGLWPQPESLQYCGVTPPVRRLDETRRWAALPPVPLQAGTANELGRVMPGAASGLERHEWVRHGSCYGADAETYYRTALALTNEVNRSRLRERLAGQFGATVTLSQLRAAFEQSFGAGAGSALGLRCIRAGRRLLLSEIRISLRPPRNEPAAPVSGMAEALDRSSPAQSNCEAGEVDRAGLD